MKRYGKNVVDCMANVDKLRAFGVVLFGLGGARGRAKYRGRSTEPLTVRL